MNNTSQQEPMDILTYNILTGDINFPSTITTWDKGDIGCTPIPKNGSKDQKTAFHLLNEISNFKSLSNG